MGELFNALVPYIPIGAIILILAISEVIKQRFFAATKIDTPKQAKRKKRKCAWLPILTGLPIGVLMTDRSGHTAKEYVVSLLFYAAVPAMLYDLGVLAAARWAIHKLARVGFKPETPEGDQD